MPPSCWFIIAAHVRKSLMVTPQIILLIVFFEKEFFHSKE